MGFYKDELLEHKCNLPHQTDYETYLRFHNGEINAWDCSDCGSVYSISNDGAAWNWNDSDNKYTPIEGTEVLWCYDEPIYKESYLAALHLRLLFKPVRSTRISKESTGGTHITLQVKLDGSGLNRHKTVDDETWETYKERFTELPEKRVKYHERF